MCDCHSGCVGGDAFGSKTVGARDVWYSVMGVDHSGCGGFVHCSGIHSALVRARVPYEATRNIDTNGLSIGGVMIWQFYKLNISVFPMNRAVWY